MLDKVMPWMILWAVSTTGVLVLFIWRVMVARHERAGIFIVHGEEPDLEEQVKVTKSLERIDRWGKSLTMVSVILLLVVGSLWALDVWRAAYETAK